MERLRQRAIRILLRQDLIEGIRHQGRHALEEGLAQRVQVAGAIPMGVLTAPHAGLLCRLCLAEAGDVDEQAVVGVDPAGVDDVLAVPHDALDVEGVHIQEVLAMRYAPVGGFGGVVVHGHVEVIGEV